MLNLLVKYAQDNSLVAEPGFAPKTAKWVLIFGSSGNFLDVNALGDASLKNNPGLEFPRCPEWNFSEMKALKGEGAHFLLTSCDVVALYQKESREDEEPGKLAGKHAYFVELLRQASVVMPELEAVADALNDPETLTKIQGQLKEKKAKPTDKATLRIGTEYPVHSTAWHDWWRAFRKTLRGAEAETLDLDDTSGHMLCFATGNFIVPAVTHPKIEGLSDVGGMGVGSPLIGFDKDAFESYALKQSANAAISEASASAYRAALNRLITKHSKRLAGMKITHWFSHNSQVPVEDDPLAGLFEPDTDDAQPSEQDKAVAQNRAKKLLEGIQSGKRPDLAGSHYYAMTLSGASGRVMLRDWMTGQFPDLVASINQWFDDLAITNFSGSNLVKTPGLERVITCLLPPRPGSQQYADWIKPLGAARFQLWKAALQKDTPIPHSALARVVLAHRVFIQTGVLEEAQKNKRDEPLIISLLHARMGLLKAYHKRKGEDNLSQYLNEDHPDPEYQCGRLMAVLASLQQTALGPVGANVIQRYYAAASVTPALVLGRLIRISQFHINTLKQKKRPKDAAWHQYKIADIMSRIKDGIPATLTLEQQSLFALGYYQQIATGFKSTPDENAPSDEETNDV